MKFASDIELRESIKRNSINKVKVYRRTSEALFGTIIDCYYDCYPV